MSAPAVLGPLPEVVRSQHPLDVFFAPQSVAVFGATEAPGSVGRALTSNLITSPFGGILYPIHPTRIGALRPRAYRRLQDVPGPVELALIATPAPTVPDIISECIAAGVKGAVVLSAGFSDSGPVAADLERRIRERLQGGAPAGGRSQLPGRRPPAYRLQRHLRPCHPPRRQRRLPQPERRPADRAPLPRPPEDVGCSAFVSVGSLLDIGWAEWLDYLAEDARTECIAIYAEAIADPRSFFAAARRVAPHKPVILVKGGQPEQRPGGALRDDLANDVFDEACRSTGVLRVGKIADLFRMAGVLTSQPRPRGRQLSILSNARGPAVLAADALLADGGRLAPLDPATVSALESLLGPRWNRQNPIDLGDDAGPRRFAQAARLAVQDTGTDALLVLLTPHGMIEAAQAAEAVAALAGSKAKPILACWLWGASSGDCLASLRQAGIPCFFSPEAAVRAFGYLWRYDENLRCLRQLAAALEEDEQAPNVGRADRAIQTAQRAGRTLLSDFECQELLAAYHLPMVATLPGRTEEEAVEAAAALGCPVLLRPADESADLRAGRAGVRLYAADEAGVRRAWQTLSLLDGKPLDEEQPAAVKLQPWVHRTGCDLAVRSITDLDFGPVLEVRAGGFGGTSARRRFLALPPLSPALIREMIEEGPPFAAVRAAFDGDSVDLTFLEQFFQRFNRLIVEQPRIQEVRIGALRVARDGATVLEACVQLHGPEVHEEQLPAPVLR